MTNGNDIDIDNDDEYEADTTGGKRRWKNRKERGFAGSDGLLRCNNNKTGFDQRDDDTDMLKGQRGILHGRKSTSLFRGIIDFATGFSFSLSIFSSYVFRWATCFLNRERSH
jgi:hypothetical protein